MATVLVGAALGGVLGGTAAAGTGFALMGLSGAAAGILGGALLGGTAGAGMTALNQPDQDQIAPVSTQVADRTTAQAAEQLQAAELGDEESEKRKRMSAKSKFKIKKADLDATSDVGVTIDKSDQVTGVQI